MDKLLDWWENFNKYKHGKHWNYQRKHFSMFLLLVDGMMYREAHVVLTTLSKLMAAKID